MRKPSEWYSARKEKLKNLWEEIKEQINQSNEHRKAFEAEDEASSKEDPGIVIDFHKIFPEWRDSPPS